MANGLFSRNSAWWGDVVCGRAAAGVLGFAKSNVRKNAGRFCRSMNPYTPPRGERRVVSGTDGPPIVSSSRPAAASSESRIASRSSRRRFIRTSSALFGSTARTSGRVRSIGGTCSTARCGG